MAFYGFYGEIIYRTLVDCEHMANFQSNITCFMCYENEMDLFNDNRTNRNQSRCGPSQWETPLHWNGVSDWLGAYLGCFRYQYIHWRSDSCDSGSDCALQYFVKNLYVLGWTVKGPTLAYWRLCTELSAFYLECNLWTATIMALKQRVALMPTLF